MFDFKKLKTAVKITAVVLAIGFTGSCEVGTITLSQEIQLTAKIAICACALLYIIEQIENHLDK